MGLVTIMNKKDYILDKCSECVADIININEPLYKEQKLLFDKIIHFLGSIESFVEQLDDKVNNNFDTDLDSLHSRITNRVKINYNKLHAACLDDDMEKIYILVKEGLDIELKDVSRSNLTPLQLSILKDKRSAVSLLLKLGATLNLEWIQKHENKISKEIANIILSNSQDTPNVISNKRSIEDFF